MYFTLKIDFLTVFSAFLQDILHLGCFEPYDRYDDVQGGRSQLVAESSPELPIAKVRCKSRFKHDVL